MGALEFRFLGMGGMADLKSASPAPHMCYLADRGRSALKGVAMDRGESLKVGSAA